MVIMMIFWIFIGSNVLPSKILGQDIKFHVDNISITNTITLKVSLEIGKQKDIILPRLDKYFEFIIEGSPSMFDVDSFLPYKVIFIKDLNLKPFGYLQWCYEIDSNFNSKIKEWSRLGRLSIDSSLNKYTLDTIKSGQKKVFSIKLNRKVVDCLSRHGGRWQLRIFLTPTLLSYFNHQQFESGITCLSNEFRIFKPNFYRLMPDKVIKSRNRSLRNQLKRIK